MAQVHLRFSDIPDVPGGVDLHGSFLGGIDPESRAHRLARAIISYVDRHMQRLTAPKETITGNVVGEDAHIEMELADEPEARALRRTALLDLLAQYRETSESMGAADERGTIEPGAEATCREIETRILELVGLAEPTQGGSDVGGTGRAGRGDETAQDAPTDDGPDCTVRDVGRADPTGDRGVSLEGLVPDEPNRPAGTY